MVVRLRRLWRAMCYDPLVEYQRAKALLEKRLFEDVRERSRPMLRLVRSSPEADE